MSEPIPEEKLAEWEALEKAATPGPWFPHESEESFQREPRRCDGITTSPERYAGSEIVETDRGVYPPDMPDALFIAASREAVPALIAEVRRLREIAKAYNLEAARRLEAMYDRTMAERAEERKAAKP